MLQALDTFHEMARAPLGRWREHFTGHVPFGFMNAFAPEELIHAAGWTPVLLRHGREESGRSKAHLPGFSCWVVRSALEQALAGELAGWGGVLFVQSCDALQALGDLWSHAVPEVPGLFLAMPHHLEAPAARPYLLAELGRLRGALGELAGSEIGDEALRASVSLYNRRRQLLCRLHEPAERVDPASLHDALSAAFLMPVELYNPLLEGLLGDLLGQGPPGAPRQGARLFIVGSELADAALYELLGASGARVVGDLLDLGYRHFAGDVDERGDPLDALADHLLGSCPTPTKYHPGRRRADLLLEQVSATRADGVIFARQKFCDPHGFDYVPLKKALDREDVPHLLIELEQTPNLGQMRTRVEAFLEMLAQPR